MIDWTQRPEALAEASRLLRVDYRPADCSWLASVGQGGELLGVVVYSRFTPSNCEMSVAAASARFLSKQALKSFFGYPFHQLGLLRVTAVVEVGNARSFRLVTRLGFKPEGYLRKWFGEGRDAVVLGLLREDCKWL